MTRILVRFAINALAIWLVGQLNIGVTVAGADGALLAALLFGVVNSLIRPVLICLTLPLQVLTLGLFTLVVNALMFWLAAWLAGIFGIGFAVSGFWAAFFGAILTSIISTVLSVFVPEPSR